MTSLDSKCEIKQCLDPTVDISHYCEEDSEKSFAEIIGCIENLIISDQFYEIQSRFLEEYYGEFEDEEENRLIYMDIFKNYLETVEKYIEEELLKKIPEFSLKTFESQLEQRSNELDGEVYEMLSTFWNFDSFKSMFLEYKKLKQGHIVDFSKDILVTKYHVNETEFL
ncbi:ADP-ribosylation factor-like protein 2-binding protein [Anthonomus grandis grandis]|uniref:ADP-ribosylation factor-like protein 2-binding protein n=1 Tax=Anthonomus grandis grandis TaxID=2921223 RepID=UPI002165FBEE|nr:ADP-ribosylation factor-like protein 2-binding protein [Anthonomus grandis grandis]